MYVNISSYFLYIYFLKIILDFSLVLRYRYLSLCDLYCFIFLFKKLKIEILVYLGLVRDFRSMVGW